MKLSIYNSFSDDYPFSQVAFHLEFLQVLKVSQHPDADIDFNSLDINYLLVFV